MDKIRIAIVAAFFAGAFICAITPGHAQQYGAAYYYNSYEDSPLNNPNKRYVGENGGG